MISETACIVEKWIDEYIEALQSNDSVVRRNVKALIITNRVKPREAKKIANHFNKLLSEIAAVLDLCHLALQTKKVLVHRLCKLYFCFLFS